MSELAERFEAVSLRIAESAARSGRRPEDVRLVAVSKLHPAAAVAELVLCRAAQSGLGRPLFGESYMQEAREKIPAVREILAAHASEDGALAAPEWHFIGHVQSKKARDIAGRFALIHSVDSLKLAQALQKACQNRAVPVGLDDAAPGPQKVLVQVNVGREDQKSGVAPEALEPLLLGIAAMPELALEGLMCIPPLARIGAESRPYFAMLRDLRETAQSLCGLALPELSMGMSDDFEAAIEEGATLVRIGTDIFGPRK